LSPNIRVEPTAEVHDGNFGVLTEERPKSSIRMHAPNDPRHQSDEAHTRSDRRKVIADVADNPNGGFVNEHGIRLLGLDSMSSKR
jgi:microcystin degradation protein MlrC